MLTDQQQSALVSGGENTLHSHPHTVTHDQLSRMQQLEKVVFVSAAYVAMPDDDFIFADSTVGVFNITLPVARAGQHVTVSRVAGANNVTLLPTGSDTINGAASLVINTTNSPARLKAITALGYLNI